MFEGVAHEALAECVYSLEAASAAIKAKKVRHILEYSSKVYTCI